MSELDTLVQRCRQGELARSLAAYGLYLKGLAAPGQVQRGAALLDMDFPSTGG
jgi:hypothetical protein